jgi:hypothetical protein
MIAMKVAVDAAQFGAEHTLERDSVWRDHRHLQPPLASRRCDLTANPTRDNDDHVTGARNPSAGASESALGPLSACEGCDHDCLDGMHAILSLVEHERRRRFEHFVGDFEFREAVAVEDLGADGRVGVVKRGEGVEELRVRVARHPHRPAIHLVGA